MDTATLDTTTPQQTATVADQPMQASPVADPAQAQQASAPPTGADGIQAGYSAPTDPSITGQPQQDTRSFGQRFGDRVAGANGPDEQQQGGQSVGDRIAGVGAHMLHGILSALGGTQDTTYSVDANGKLVASQIPSGPGMQFKRIIAGAVAGLAAGAGQTGPGHLGRALAAGSGAGMQQAQEQTAQAKAQAEQDYDKQQKGIVQKAQMAHMAAETIATNIHATHEQMEDAYNTQERANQRQKEVEAQGGSVVGEGKNIDDMMRLHQGDPEIMKAFTDQRIIPLPQTTQEFKHNGIRFMMLPPGAPDARQDHDMVIPGRLIPAKSPGTAGPDGLPTKAPDETLLKGLRTNGEANRQILARENENQAAMNAASKGQLELAQAGAANATTTQKLGENATAIQKERIAAGATVQAARLRGQYEMLTQQVKLGNQPDAQGVTPVRKISQMVFDGAMDPSQMSKKGTNLTAQQADLDDLAKQQGMDHFPMAKATADYKQASDVQTRADLANMATLTGIGGKPGVLDQIVQMSKELKVSNFPALNNATQWAQLESGNPKVAAYHAKLLDAADLTGRILANGGVVSDAKLQAGQKLYDQGFSTPQMAAVATAQKQVLGARKEAKVANNMYLNRWYGNDGIGDPQNPRTQQIAQQSAAPAAAGGLVTVKLANGTQGHVSSAQLAKFQQDHPGSSVVQ